MEARRMVREAIQSIDPVLLKGMIERDEPVWPVIRRHLDGAGEEVRFTLKIYWKDVEKELTDVRRVYRLLCRNERVKEVLSQPKAIAWLNKEVEECYCRLYDWVWRGK
jgi:hypothetical protein